MTRKVIVCVVFCHSAYSSIELWRVIRRQYRAEAMIDPNPRHRQMNERVIKTTEWKRLYRRRNAIERLNGRLKGFRKLDSVRVRGRHKVMVHALLACMVTQARALAFPESIRRCVGRTA